MLLNIILALVICVFVLCSLHFVRHEKKTSIIEPSTSNKNNSRTTSYYDYEPYLNNISARITPKIRRFYYIDLGCFDGRDIDYFIHFHIEEISHLGTLDIIAFEPDPINFSACKSEQKLLGSLNKTVYNAAVWTENGQVPYATERGQKSKIDENSALYIRSIDFSQWISDNFATEDYLYVKFTIEGAEIPILEKMTNDRSLSLIDFLEIEWNSDLSPDFEPRRISLECMFDNFGMDFLYMVNPVDLRHAFNLKDTYTSVPKDRTW
jgi:FkbM family methyltransferase